MAETRPLHREDLQGIGIQRPDRVLRASHLLAQQHGAENILA